MLILSARVIWAISIFSRWLTGSDWLSQGQDEESAPDLAAAEWADARPAEAAPAEAARAGAGLAVASPTDTKTAANAAAAAIPGRRRMRELRISVIARPPLPAAKSRPVPPGASIPLPMPHCIVEPQAPGVPSAFRSNNS